MTAKKPTLTLSDLLSQEAPANADAPEPVSSPLGDREAIRQRTRLMRDKTATVSPQPAQVPEPVNKPEDFATATLDGKDNPVAEQSTTPSKAIHHRTKPPKATAQRNDDKVTRSIQFSRATYRQMEKTLNYIAYKSGRRDVSFPKYFEKLHELARQQPDLMNQIIDHFKNNSPD